MTYAWETLTKDALHPRLDPVSAWLFRAGSPLLAPEVPDPDLAQLFSMPLSETGFDPSGEDAFRAMLVENPNAVVDIEAHPFRAGLIKERLAPNRTSFQNPRVTVLPLPNSAPRSVEALRRAQGIGSPVGGRPAQPWARPEAIIGVIDHSINIFHERFRHGTTGTRVMAAWMQSAPRSHARGVPFGREWVQAEIEAAQVEAGRDEDALLRQIGADFETPGHHGLARRLSHGTHVMDLAGGMAPDDARGPTVPLIAVTLPPVVVRETSGSMLGIPFVLGLEFICDRARILMRETRQMAPVFVNVSVGVTGGPRSGLHHLEQSIARIAEHHEAELAEHFPEIDELPKLTVVVAAGNNNLAQAYAEARDGVLDLGWQLQPADPTSNVCEMRFVFEGEADAARTFAVSLTPPGATDPVTVNLELDSGRSISANRLLTQAGAPIGRLSAWITGHDVRQRTVILTLSMEGTDPGRSQRPVTSAGLWGVRAHCVSHRPLRANAWILRDDVPGGFGDSGRQSYFVDPLYRRYDEVGRSVTEDPPEPDAAILPAVRRSGSLNALGTGGHAADTLPYSLLRVGGYVDDAMGRRPAGYSASPLDQSEEAIDVSAPSDQSDVRLGIRAAGTRTGTKARISGTSAAAPQVLRHLALGDGVLEDEEQDVSPRMGAQILRPSG